MVIIGVFSGSCVLLPCYLDLWGACGAFGKCSGPWWLAGLGKCLPTSFPPPLAGFSLGSCLVLGCFKWLLVVAAEFGFVLWLTGSESLPLAGSLAGSNFLT